MHDSTCLDTQVPYDAQFINVQEPEKWSTIRSTHRTTVQSRGNDGAVSRSGPRKGPELSGLRNSGSMAGVSVGKRRFSGMASSSPAVDSFSATRQSDGPPLNEEKLSKAPCDGTRSVERAAEMNSGDYRSGAEERSCTSALSPLATGPALAYAGWWSRIFTAAVDRPLERRFVPATRPHTTESADGSVELNAFEGATVGTCTRVVRRHALSGCSSAAISEHRSIIVCKSVLLSATARMSAVGRVRVGVSLTTTEQRSKLGMC